MLNFKYERVNDAMRSWTMIFSSTNTHTMHHTHDTLRSMHPPMHHTHGPCDVWIVRVSGQQTGTVPPVPEPVPVPVPVPVVVVAAAGRQTVRQW